MAGLRLVALLFSSISLASLACEPSEVLAHWILEILPVGVRDEHKTQRVQRLMNASPNETARIYLTTELENTYWKLVGLGEQPPVTNVGPREIHIRLFSQGKMVQGFAGCNQLRGRYDLEEEYIRFSGLATTRKVCAERMEQEHAFLEALRMTARWNIEGEHLEFSTAEHGLLARFEARSSK